MQVEQSALDQEFEAWISTFRHSGFDCTEELRDRAYSAVHHERDRGASFERSVTAGLKVLARSLS
jgi:hypothetical protein